jgi:Fic family protein
MEIVPTSFNTVDFIEENNKIEGISRPVNNKEIKEHQKFMQLEQVTISDLKKFVKIYQPGAVLRDKPGLNVRIGGHVPPPGSIYIREKLIDLLEEMHRLPLSAYKTHIKYENLHPFTDGNGRSGRILWLWQMKKAPLGFLHTFYYQTLKYGRKFN